MLGNLVGGGQPADPPFPKIHEQDHRHQHPTTGGFCDDAGLGWSAHRCRHRSRPSTETFCRLRPSTYSQARRSAWSTATDRSSFTRSAQTARTNTAPSTGRHSRKGGPTILAHPGGTYPCAEDPHRIRHCAPGKALRKNNLARAKQSITEFLTVCEWPECRVQEGEPSTSFAFAVSVTVPDVKLHAAVFLFRILCFLRFLLFV